jgi:hypothetical protein
MKVTFLLALLISSYSALAAFNEVECEGHTQGKFISVEVEEAFPRGSVFRRAQVYITEQGAQTRHDFNVTARPFRGFNRVRYDGPGINLEVDFWPDQMPRWGWTYRGTFSSAQLGNRMISLNCRFPFARP